jgi:hypothetical protein
MSDPSPEVNPYAPPNAPPGAASVATGDAPGGVPLAVPLFSPGDVFLAAFLGTPVAGGVVLAINELRMARKARAITVLAAGVVTTALLVTLTFVTSESFTTWPIALGGVVGVALVARSTQGPQVRRHLAVGGKKANGWLAVGIGLLSLVAYLVVVVAIGVVVDAASGR